MNKPIAVIMESTVEASCPQVEIDELRENSEEIGTALKALGYDVEIIPFSLDTADIRGQLEKLKPEVAFNLVDSIEGKGNLISLSPMLLAHMDIPFTGATALSTAVTCDKLVTKQVLRAGNLRTPDWLTEKQINAAVTPLASPYILKSITEHASFGMFADSVVNDSATLRARWQEKKAKYGSEWFAEEYVEGREFNLSVIALPEGGARVLPHAEIVFTDVFPKDKPRIVDYAAKWYEDSNECKGTVRSFEFNKSDDALLAALQQIALQCWDAFALTGYARVDFRVNEKGVPYVLEVNSNPFLTANEGFGSAASRLGWNFTEVIRRIVMNAYARAAKPLPKMLAA
jgi:D-alanine-D-alanine ligase